jgi:DNA-binding response OmpR family regulator
VRAPTFPPASSRSPRCSSATRQVQSREQLLSDVWGYDFDPRSNVVDVYVGYLRKKLGKEAISSVRGMGYRLERSADA